MPKRKIQNKVQHSRAALQAQIHATGKLNHTLRKRAQRYSATAREFDQLHRDHQALQAQFHDATCASDYWYKAWMTEQSGALLVREELVRSRLANNSLKQRLHDSREGQKTAWFTAGLVALALVGNIVAYSLGY